MERTSSLHFLYILLCLFSGTQVFHRFVFQRNVAVEAQAAFSGRALGLDAHLHRLFHRQMEQPHHIEIFAVQRIMGAEHKPFKAIWVQKNPETVVVPGFLRYLTDRSALGELGSATSSLETVLVTLTGL